MKSATATRSLLFAGTADDPGRVALPPGRYRLTATRGLDWGIARADVEIAGPGAEVQVEPFSLEPLPRLSGARIADLHVHAQASDDSQTPNEQRLRAYVAEGVDVLVATDHDNVPDYRPALERSGLGDRLRVVHGVEITSSTPSRAAPWTIGHHNAWPIEPMPLLHRRGAPPSQNREVGTLYASLRADYGARVVQLNHPRNADPRPQDGRFFSHLGHGVPFDPEVPVAEQIRLVAAARDGTRAIDFDAVEVMNGVSYSAYRAVRRDWHALLLQGFRRTATANSDTHGPGELAAYPRNYVWVGQDVGEAGESVAFDAALLAGRSFGTTGPRVREFRIGSARPGDLVSADGRIVIDYEVDAAAWVPLEEVRIVVNGRVAHRTANREGRVVLDIGEDAFVCLEAGAPLDVDPDAWRAAHPGAYTESVAPGFVSTAFTNPIFVDVDGNARYDAPGLP